MGGYQYVVVCFVKGDRVHVFEAAGLKEKLAADLPELEKAILDWPGI
jgi:hypothetical protein